jgi:uroporphyrinogen-III synthase
LRVLITRPRDEAQGVARELAVRGIDSAVEPLLVIVLRPAAALRLDHVQAVLLTSANGARALARTTDRRDVAILAVGAATARAARAEGFARVESAEGSVATLADAARARLNPVGDPLLHISGADVAGDLAGDLARAGFAVERQVLYDAVAAPALSAETADGLRQGLFDAVLLFSPRTATTFVSLLRQAGMEQAAARMEALCLSPAVAAAARGLPWRRVRVAGRPSQEALLRLIGNEEP